MASEMNAQRLVLGGMNHHAPRKKSSRKSLTQWLPLYKIAFPEVPRSPFADFTPDVETISLVLLENLLILTQAQVEYVCLLLPHRRSARYNSAAFPHMTYRQLTHTTKSFLPPLCNIILSTPPQTLRPAHQRTAKASRWILIQGIILHKLENLIFNCHSSVYCTLDCDTTSSLQLLFTYSMSTKDLLRFLSKPAK